MSYEWNFDFLQDHWPMLLVGLWGTLRIAAVAVVIGLAAGAVLAAMRMAAATALPGSEHDDAAFLADDIELPADAGW